MKNKEGSFKLIAVFMFASLVIALNWENWTWLKSSIHSIFDPSFGVFLNWNLTIGMIVLVFLLSLIMTLVQKYTTDQKELKQLKKEQKELQKKINELKEDPQKMMEVQKELLPLTNKQMKLSMRTIMYTGIPLVFLFRWFNDYFISAGNPKIFGMSWFIFYLIFSMVFSIILKKKLDVV